MAITSTSQNQHFPRELAPTEDKPLSIAELYSLLKGEVGSNDVTKIAKVQRRLISHTAAVRDDAYAMTATFQIVFDQAVPLKMRKAVDSELERDSNSEFFETHTNIVKKQRTSDRTLAYQQDKVFATLEDPEGFLGVAVKYGWFEKSVRFWQFFLKFVKKHTHWPKMLKMLRKQFFNTHSRDNDWVALAKMHVHDYITARDIEILAKTDIDSDLVDPFDDDSLRRQYSLQFDDFGLVDPVSCGQEIFAAITKEIGTWRRENPNREVPQFSNRVKLATVSLTKADTVTADSIRDRQLEGHVANSSGRRSMELNHFRADQDPTRRRARASIPLTTTDNQAAALSNIIGATNACSVAVAGHKRRFGAKQRTSGRTDKQAKHKNSTASDQADALVNDAADDESGYDEDEVGEEVPGLSETATVDPSLPVGPLVDLGYTSELEEETYSDSCRKVTTMFKTTLQFINSWIEQAHNYQESDTELEQLKQHLESFEKAKPLISEGGYRLATEWKVQGSLTREVFDQASNARTSADVWSLTTTQACELMDLDVPVGKPVVGRSKEHLFSLSDFLCQMEHKYTLDGELSVQGGTADNPEELVSNMQIREVLQRLKVMPDLQDPLSFRPLNCLDIAAFWPYISVPTAIQHSRFSVVSAMRSRILRKDKMFAKPGKQSSTKNEPPRVSVRAADMEFCAAFMLLASTLAFSFWHEDLLNNTWVQCLTGKKAWFMHVNDSEDPPAVVILEPGDWLLMPAGLRVRHAVLTVEGPSVMVGGQHLDGHALIPQLNQITELMKCPERTNESVPALQLPAIIDEIIEYLDENQQDSRIFKVADNADNTSSLAKSLKDWRDMARNTFGCTCASDGQAKCIAGQCSCLSKSHKDSTITRRCTPWCAGKHHVALRDVDKPKSCFYDQAC